MESEAEMLARRHTLQELELMEKESRRIRNDMMGATAIGIASCLVGAGASVAGVTWLALAAIIGGGIAVCIGIFSGGDVSTDIIREAVAFKKARLQAK